MIGWAPGTLRRRLALAMTAAAALAVLIGTMGLWALGALQTVLWKRSLPTDVLSAFEAMENGDAPPAALLPRMMAYGDQLERSLPIYDGLSILFCGLLGLVAAVIVSIWFSRRLVGPIEAVAGAAAAVAEGNLTARVGVDAHAAGEIRHLQDNFNSLVEALQRAERETRENAAAIAHELRTPLTVLRLKLQAFRDGIGQASPDQLGLLIGQVDLLARLVEDLRTLSLANAGRLELSVAPLDLSVLAAEVAEAMRPGLDASGVTLRTHLSSALIIGDPLRLRQCIQALLDNVGRHAASGREARLETGSEGDRAWLAVLDRGPGFSPADTGRAFDRFWRADGSRSRQTGGSGLGLSVVAAIAAAHGGDVSIRPRDGIGACLRLSFPADEATQAKISARDRSAAAAAGRATAVSAD